MHRASMKLPLVGAPPVVGAEVLEADRIGPHSPSVDGVGQSYRGSVGQRRVPTVPTRPEAPSAFTSNL